MDGFAVARRTMTGIRCAGTSPEVVAMRRSTSAGHGTAGHRRVGTRLGGVACGTLHTCATRLPCTAHSTHSGCARLLEITVAYALQREQFGAAIGSFQAVKHHCADMASCGSRRAALWAARFRWTAISILCKLSPASSNSGATSPIAASVAL